MALRRTPKNETEVWARELANGDMAVGLLNKGASAQGSPGIDNCQWKVLTGGYNESCGGDSGNSGHMDIHSLEDAKKKCCGLGKSCVSASVPVSGRGPAYFKKNDGCGWKVSTKYNSLIKLVQGPQPVGPPPPPPAAVITASFAMVGWPHPTAKVRDLWAHSDLGTLSSLSVTVPAHGLALLRLSPAAAA
jgi:hypothetical protein